ncbi:MAG TPA: hypothetical protein VK211_29035, partial [Kamptonema sp.]|nr:hypothetical protein [Kamptonema sp.]
KLNALSKIAVKYAEIGQFDLAIHTLEKINAPSWKGSTLCKIACKFAEAGQYERAFELVEMIEHRERKEEGLDNLAKIYAEAGQYNRALQTAKLIKDVELKHSAITKVVEKYVEFGHYDRAFKIVKKSRRNDFKANFLWILAKGLTKNEISNQNPENLSQLLQCSLSIKNNGVNGSDIVSLAIKIVIIEQCIRIIKSDKATEVLSQAIAQIEILKSPTEKIYALTNLATRYLELGYKTNALTALYQILNTIDDRKLLSDKTLSSKADTLMVIASLLVEAGECEQALQIIEKIEISDQFSWSRQGSAMSKCMALFDVAKKYAELNQKDKTVEILSKILQVSDLDDSYKASYIDAVAKIYFSLEFPSRV